ncbi:minor extracellular protease vpr [Apiospora arundinis]
MWGTCGIKTFEILVPMQLVPDVKLPGAVEVASGEIWKVTVTFTNPKNKGWNATVLPLYSGKVQIVGSNGERLSVAYMGVAASLYKTKRVSQKGYPMSLSGVNYNNIDVDATYNFDPKAESFNWPKVYSILDWGAQELRWDLFESDWDESRWTYPSTAADGLVGPVARWMGDQVDAGSSVDLSDPDVVKANAVAAPFRYLPRDGIYSRSQSQYTWLGHLANGTIAKPGNYTMRVAAARPFADLSKAEGWEVWRHEIMVIA